MGPLNQSFNVITDSTSFFPNSYSCSSLTYLLSMVQAQLQTRYYSYHVINCSNCVLRQFKFNESKTSVLLSLIVEGDLYINNVTKWYEGRPQHLLCHLISKTSCRKELSLCTQCLLFTTNKNSAYVHNATVARHQ